MFKVKQTTFMQSVLDAELNSFHEDHAIEATKTIPQDDFVNGHILFKIPIKKKFMDDILNFSRNPVYPDMMDKEQFNSNFHEGRHEEGLFENVTDQIINIPVEKSYAECIDIIIDYKNTLKDNFYGAVLRTTNNAITINPFHILTTLSVLNDEEFQNKKWNIIVFVYKDRKALNIFTKNHVADPKLINRNIDSLMNAYISRVHTETRIVRDENAPNDTSSDRIRVSVQTKKFKDEDTTYNHYISAHQLITKGVLAPYYGASLIRMNGTTSGLRLTPFGSCNISSDAYSEIPNPNPSYGSVCTGSLNNRTLKGLRSLSHANLGSPYGGGFIQNGCLTYADIMIEKSISLYESAGLLKEGKNIPLIIEEQKETYSEQELECKTLQEYMRLCRNENSLPSTVADAKQRYYNIVEFIENMPESEAKIENTTNVEPNNTEEAIANQQEQGF